MANAGPVVSVEWNLRLWESHPGVISAALLGADPSLHVFANRDLPPAPEPAWEPRIHRCLTVSDWFDKRPAGGRYGLLDLVRETRRKSGPLAGEVSEGLRSRRINPSLLLVQDACFFNVIALSRLCARQRLRAVFFFHTLRHRKVLRLCRWRLRRHSRTMVLTAIHPAIADSLSASIRLPCKVLSYPCDTELRCQAGAPPPCRLALLGIRSDQVGRLLEQLPGAVAPLLIEGKLALALPDKLEPACRAGLPVEALSKVHFHSSLPGSEFKRMLATSHALLLPYDAEAYRFRISAVAEEAVITGIPFVITKDTLPWEIWNGAGLCTGFKNGDPEDLGRAIRDLVENYDTYRAAAEAHAPQARENHSAEAYLGRIRELAGL